MRDMVKGFKELSPELHPLAGGKGAMLSKMFQDGYPVPTSGKANYNLKNRK